MSDARRDTPLNGAQHTTATSSSAPTRVDDAAETTDQEAAPSRLQGVAPATSSPPAEPSSTHGPTLGIFPFPSHRSTPPTSPPAPHAGPADTDSVMSSYSPLVMASRLGLNPRAREWEGGARALLLRGAPSSRDSTRSPVEGVTSRAQVARRVDSATLHAAMVYRRLTATQRPGWDAAAEEMAVLFVRHFGEAYEQEVVRLIQEEPDDPPEPEEEEPGDDDECM
ncbi:hypothetical protein LTR53_001333 [Teratosphaeriaceae sp. CCFEE 6253]|nr:hypothetical protein LTR53_001333 [Teratosphaeriaceae sp. CCFEE 6253]